MDNNFTDENLGAYGEQLAAKHLADLGYEILDTNYRMGKKEVDIVAKDGDVVVFVEVKTRNNRYLGEPYEAVTKAKQKTIVKVANAFLEEHNLQLAARFDIVSVIANSKWQDLEHLKDAFYPM